MGAFSGRSEVLRETTEATNNLHEGWAARGGTSGSQVGCKTTRYPLRGRHFARWYKIPPLSQNGWKNGGPLAPHLAFYPKPPEVDILAHFGQTCAWAPRHPLFFKKKGTDGTSSQGCGFVMISVFGIKTTMLGGGEPLGTPTMHPQYLPGRPPRLHCRWAVGRETSGAASPSGGAPRPGPGPGGPPHPTAAGLRPLQDQQQSLMREIRTRS